LKVGRIKKLKSDINSFLSNQQRIPRETKLHVKEDNKNEKVLTDEQDK
jgi:hypothetical protein